MTIKETAGKILLYVYQVQRTAPTSLRYRQLGFLEKKDGKMALTSDKKWLTKDLQSINANSADIYNAYRFLLDKGMVRSNERTSGSARVYLGINLTDVGVDIVEGIERSSEGKEAFADVFNIKVKEGLNVEGLIEDKLKDLLEQE